MKTRKKTIIKKVGITGAAGTIGEILTQSLSDDYDLTLFYNHTEVKNNKIKKFKVNLIDAEEIRGKFEGLDTVIHLAGDRKSHSPWESILNKNIIATYNVFEEAQRAGVAKVIFASTNMVQHGQSMLGEPNPSASYDVRRLESMKLAPFFVRHKGYIRLSDPPTPNSYYAVSKLFGENLGWYYSRIFNIQVIALRIGSIGKNDDPSSVKGTMIEDYVRAMYLSKRDCVEAFKKALEVEIDYLVAYVISDNDRRFFDMKESMEKLGTNPKDNSEDYYK